LELFELVLYLTEFVIELTELVLELIERAANSQRSCDGKEEHIMMKWISGFLNSRQMPFNKSKHQL